jgi:hypothetical protein
MTDQPPVQPPVQPPYQPSGYPAQGGPATAPMPAGAGNPAATPSAKSTTNLWHQSTSTRGGRWAIGIAAAVLVTLMLLSVAVAGLLVLRNHDRVALVGQPQNGYSRGLGNGRGPGGNGYRPLQPGSPGMRGGGVQGLGGLGGLLGGTALHGDVTATVSGSVQALTFQRGQVTALSATSITLKSTDGFVGTYGRAAATNTLRAAPVMGGQAFVLARASDKVAITILATAATSGVGPSS